MKLKNETILYIYVAVLFVLAFLLTGRLMKNFKSGEFEYLKLAVNVLLLAYVLIKVVRLGKSINDNQRENEQ